MLENIVCRIVRLLPRSFIRAALVRAWVHATTGKWSGENSPALTMSDALSRWG